MAKTFEEASSGADLIDGDPAEVYAQVRLLRKRAKRMDKIGRKLKAVRVTGWSGPASDNFETERDALPMDWFAAADEAENAADALETYADVLKKAEGTAGEALELWQKGQNQLDLVTKVPSYAAGGQKQLASDTLFDAGQKLKEAREDVDEAGDTAAEKIETATQAIPDPDGGYADSDYDWYKHNSEATGPEYTDWNDFKLGSFEWYHRWFNHDFDYDKGPFDLSGRGGVGIGADGEFAVDGDGLHANIEAQAGGKYEVEQKIDGPGPFDITIGGDVRVGPGGEADIDIGRGDDGKVHIKGKLSGSLLFGGGVKVDIPVPEGVTDTVDKGIDKGKDLIDDGLGLIGL